MVVEAHAPSRWRILFPVANWILGRIWYLEAPASVMLRATPALCLHTLATAAKPSTQRLHLRNLFAHGRRYFLQPKQDGFRLTTTSKKVWRYRQRTSSAAVLRGTFAPFGDGVTHVHLRTHMNIIYLLRALLVPGFMTSILVYTPWPPALIALALALLYGLSWMGCRLNATLEAGDMIWFVQKALEDLVPAEILSLGADSTGVVYDPHDFEQAWERFYERHRSAQESSAS